MVDRLQIHIQNKKIKPLAIALNGQGGGQGVGGDLTNVQCKSLFGTVTMNPSPHIMNIS
jgi:hypothetical protein